MARRKALITGITGQDGSYLAEFLLDKGYEVHGVIRRVALEDPVHRLHRILRIKSRLILHAGSLESLSSLYRILNLVKPDECYHLAAQSFVSYSFDDEFSTLNTNINGTHHILTALRDVSPECRFYFAGSSEMFGRAEEIPQSELTRFHPRSAYGISKVAGFDLTRNYREAYGLHASTGILFNHESPRRGHEFVTRKITSAVAAIAAGKQKELRLGNLEACRDWGFAPDYVEAMWLMLAQDQPDDYVICTGKMHSVRDFAESAFASAGMNFLDYIVVDQELYRPADVALLIGNCEKARKRLGWSSKTSFDSLVKLMVESDLRNAGVTTQLASISAYQN
jgi:GDPmannose 4,6-dehydratase